MNALGKRPVEQTTHRTGMAARTDEFALAATTVTQPWTASTVSLYSIAVPIAVHGEVYLSCLNSKDTRSISLTRKRYRTRIAATSSNRDRGSDKQGAPGQ